MSLSTDEMSHDELVTRAVKRVLTLDRDRLMDVIASTNVKPGSAYNNILKKLLAEKIKKIAETEGAISASRYLEMSDGNIDWTIRNKSIPYSQRLHIVARNIERYENKKGITL
ncbi:MAG: hypothetical protein IMF01_09425 [Proteobacteria bacterium]|nr:hypothetical protein [Pseudomonadota bacterium]